VYKSNEIKEVHLEITQRCQAACPMCARNQEGGDDNPHLTDAELSLEDCITIFPTTFIKQLNKMYMCGNYGDPIVAKDTLDVFAYFRSNNSNMNLSMNTNGGAKDQNWWKELALVLGSKGVVTFSVDGLRDTNHIYRRNVNWDIVERSMRTFISAGGRARWDYLVFKHNEHQVDEAEAFAQELGFESFHAKRSSRVFTNGRLGKDRKGEVTLYEQPVTEKWRNPNIRPGYEQPQPVLISQLNAKPGKAPPTSDRNKTLNTVEVSCKVKQEKSVYVSAEGHILPCCWVAGEMYNRWWDPNPYTAQTWRHIKLSGGLAPINAKLHGIDGVLDNAKLFNTIEKSWKLPTVGLGKLDVCCRICDKANDHFATQWIDKKDETSV